MEHSKAVTFAVAYESRLALITQSIELVSGMFPAVGTSECEREGEGGNNAGDENNAGNASHCRLDKTTWKVGMAWYGIVILAWHGVTWHG